MDIETTLAQIRMIRSMILNGSYDDANLAALGITLADSVEALDGWLANGGYLPTAWSVNR